MDTSTIIIAGRRFPACCAVCPPVKGDDSNDWSRLLGGRARQSSQYYIPCENGILVTVEEHKGAEGRYELGLLAHTCMLSHHRDLDGLLWLPHFVGLLAGQLVCGVTRSTWYWSGAEPDWTCELVDRVATLPFVQPSGPRMKLVSIAQAHAITRQGNLGINS